jgi:hypothetical protein
MPLPAETLSASKGISSSPPGQAKLQMTMTMTRCKLGHYLLYSKYHGNMSGILVVS